MESVRGGNSRPMREDSLRSRAPDDFTACHNVPTASRKGSETLTFGVSPWLIEWQGFSPARLWVRVAPLAPAGSTRLSLRFWFETEIDVKIGCDRF
jgi:hypothetical protein